MMVYQSLFLVAALPCLSSGSILNGIRSSLSSVLHFKREGPRSHTTQAGAEWPKPDFCNDLDCPQFSVIKDKKTYQLREYVATHWVSTNSVGISFDDAEHTDFMRLFGYISGKNSEGHKIPMTAPVLNRIIPGPGPACESNFTMSFFISPSQDPAPEPTDKKVFLDSMSKMRVYVRSFPGFANEKKWIAEAAKLAEDLGSSESYIKDHYYTAGYNSPFQLSGRHNEIWFIAK